MSSCMHSKSWDFLCFHDPPCSWSPLQAYPARSPTSQTPSPVIQTPRSDPDPHTRLSYYELLAHSILKLSMRWTPSLTHPKQEYLGELNRSCSACGPPITNSLLATQAKHIPDPMDLVLQAQSSQTHAYNSHNLGNIKQTSSTSTLKHESSPFSLKLGIFAQPRASVSLKLDFLAWASVKQWLTTISRLGETFSPERAILD